MSKETSFARYSAIVNFLRNHYATFEQILDELEKQSLIQGYKFEISKRTFQRDINELRSLFNIDIYYDTSAMVYKIRNSKDEKNTILLDSFQMLSSLSLAKDLENVVIPEKRRSLGINNIHGLIHAIQNKKQIKVTYQKFYEDTPYERTLNPYNVIESQGRWYLMATKFGLPELRTYGLDRILNIEILQSTAIIDAKLDAKKFVSELFGINSEEREVERIVLKFSSFQGQYIKNYPLHHSQNIIEENEAFITFELMLSHSHDFRMEILKYGAEVEVLSPLTLRNKIHDMVKDVLKVYK